jgi:hypothetical protein
VKPPHVLGLAGLLPSSVSGCDNDVEMAGPVQRYAPPVPDIHVRRLTSALSAAMCARRSSGGTALFQMIGAFVDALLLIGVGIAGRYYTPRWVRKDGTPEEVERRFSRARKLSTILLVMGVGTLIFRLLSI